MHGVGVSVVNALSDWLELRVWRNDKVYYARFEKGECTVHVREEGDAPGEKGTEVRFMASSKLTDPEARSRTSISASKRWRRACANSPS